jgi:hypothetical protein
LAKHDLDEAMITLRREQDRLQLLLTEWDRRERARGSSSPTPKPVVDIPQTALSI